MYTFWCLGRIEEKVQMSDEKDVHTESRREGELDGECDVSSEAAPEVRIPEFHCSLHFLLLWCRYRGGNRRIHRLREKE